MEIRLLMFDGCPNGEKTGELIEDVLREEGIDEAVRIVKVESPEDALREGSLGSPSVRINGLDIEQERRGNLPSFGCRIYRSQDGTLDTPPREMIRRAIKRALAPKLKVLFLCTGNSCRSQMAEGWTRALRGDRVEPYSAGIETHGLNGDAVKVMAEAGVNISAHRCKNVSELMNIPFEYVVTVCSHANENCPVFGGRAKIVHVGFDDPPTLAREAKTKEEALNCYRRVRDEIRAFIETLPGSLKKKG